MHDDDELVYERPTREWLAEDIIRLASLWVAAGALFKLFAGSPNDLPPLVRDTVKGVLDPVNAFRTAISIELCLVVLGLFRPRAAWIPLLALFAVFGVVLWPLVVEGAASCGCFGSSITVPPRVMFGIDATFFLGILLTGPWTLERRPFLPVLILPILLGAALAPWLLFTTSAPAPVRAEPTGATSTTGGAGVTATEEPGASTDEAADAPNLGSALPSFHYFDTDAWKGEDLHTTDLADFLEVDLIPPDSHVVFFRQTCDHCKEHLEELAAEPPGPMPLVLVRVAEVGDTPENEITKVKPLDHIALELPPLERGYMIETPMALDVEGYLVREVTYLHDEE